MERTERLDGVEEPILVPDGVSLGYAHVSTVDQNLESQRRLLLEAGCYDVYADLGRSGATMVRPELEACLPRPSAGQHAGRDQAPPGRTVRGLVELLDSLHERGVKFRSLTEGIDTSTSTGGLCSTSSPRWPRWSAS